jgi:sugar lactone lactonase YvrE
VVSIGTETLVDGLGFPEGPRWHAGRLWFSDFHQRRVRSVGWSGDVRVELEPDDVPSGLGWDPAGHLLVVSMLRRQLVRVVGERTEVVADLSPWTVFGANDMAVDARGRAYIGNFGYDFVNGEEPRPTVLVMVDEHGRAGPVTAPELICPNGIVVDEERRRVVVAETFAHRLSAYELHDDGSLGDRSVLAEFDDRVEPDGIAMDDDGEIWIATCSPAVLRVSEGGSITGRLELSSGLNSYAVALGGDDGTALSVCSAPGSGVADTGRGRIEVATVDRATSP